MLNTDIIVKHILDLGIKTERLCLRKLSLDDVADMFEYTSDINNWKFIAREVHTNVSQANDFIRESIKKYDNPSDIIWGIELQGSIDSINQKLIGTIRIYNIDFNKGTCMISYLLNVAFSGKGYMTEVLRATFDTIFHSLGLKKIYADIAHGNTKSEKLVQRCGMAKLPKYIAARKMRGQNIYISRYVIERNNI